MSKQAKFLVGILSLTVLLSSKAVVAAPKDASVDEINEVVMFKIHDVIPEKDVDGKVLYCNIGATFFNNTKINISNAALTLSWEDEVISETIDQEERAEKEMKRRNANAPRSRYSTAGFTSSSIRASLKLPPLKVGQQVSLKTKVDTDRCFLLLNDMDINVNSCGTAGMDGKVSRKGCKDLFRYVSPKMEEYYVEFKEVSPAEERALEDSELDAVRKEMDAVYNNTIVAIKDITSDKAIDNNSDEVGKSSSFEE